MPGSVSMVDGNKAVADVAYRLSEVISIYPITPASPMGEHADEWSANDRDNLWGTVPDVVEMQSEKGAAGAVHGSLQTGALTSTFTASQGLLLMIPNMYKIAGELSPTVFHIASRSVASHALSIFGDHSDVMAARQTGFGMLFGGSVQEAQDMALIAHASTLRSRVPFLNVFDGFRTSHELSKIEYIKDEVLDSLVDRSDINDHRDRAMDPEDPVLRGSAQNPDVFFQSKEASNPYYRAVPDVVQNVMDEFAEETGRQYNLFDYVGPDDAKRVVVMMGSGSETAHETVNAIGEKEGVGLLKVRLFRPLSAQHLLEALPDTTKSIAALDRTKEPGSSGEPLYQDVLTALNEGQRLNAVSFHEQPDVVGGRYGLGSKEFTPAMAKSVFDNLDQPTSKNHFTVGINDDVTHTSLDWDPEFSTDDPDRFRGVFWGLGSDGTVSANKNSIKIIGENTEYDAQGYFVYDSKKAGARTISHLRFGHGPIRSTYQISDANFVAVHQFSFLEKYNKFHCLDMAEEGATFLLNSPYGPDDVWAELPEPVQEQIIEKDLEMYVIDAHSLAGKCGLANRINTIMQTAFFLISDILPEDEAYDKIKSHIRSSYGKRGETVVKNNFQAVDSTEENLYKVDVPDTVQSEVELEPVVPQEAPDFVQDVTSELIAGKGDELPTSKMPDDGTFPTETTKWEKRDIAQEVPIWDEELCIQCGKCDLVCPHSTIRAKVVDEEDLEDAPDDFKTDDAMWSQMEDNAKYTLQVAMEDCTGCSLCVEVCPAKDKSEAGRKAINMEPQREYVDRGKEHWDYFTDLPSKNQSNGGDLTYDRPKNVQLLDPLFEFSSACAGCGETPYLKLMTQFAGDRALIANATGCSSIYGGNLPTNPWSTNDDGYGPSWNNSLFEDNAEFGLGMRLGVDQKTNRAHKLLEELSGDVDPGLAREILESSRRKTSDDVDEQRGRIEQLRDQLRKLGDERAGELLSLSPVLVDRSVWIVGGDGWAYDIGYGGLDHTLSQARDINVLVLDTEVYSNTGGQASKATPQGAAPKFAMAGKEAPKKDLGIRAMMMGNVYVAQIAMGADDTQSIKAIREAEAYNGPSLVMAYSTCIAHGIDMSKGMDQMEKAVKSGHWPLYRFDPCRRENGETPLQLDFNGPEIPLKEFYESENRFRILMKSKPERAENLLNRAQENVKRRWELYQKLADEDG